jgi:hypothetical protein
MAEIAILLAIQTGLAVAESLLQSGAPKQQPIDRGKQDDLRFTIVEEGAFIPRVYGDWVRLGGNIFWGTPTQEHKTSTPGSSGGKKGRGAEPPTNTFSYDKSLAVYFCEGPVRSFLKIQEGDTILFNQSVGFSSYYEAEKSGNTLAGGATIVADSTLLSGRKVRLPPGASVIIANVKANFSSTYDIGIYFQSNVDIPFTVRINNTTDYSDDLPDSDNALDVFDLTGVTLTTGANTVKITNDHGSATLDIDRIFVFAELPDDDDVTGIVDVDGTYPADPNNPAAFYNKPLRVNGAGQASGTTAVAGQAQIEVFLGTEDQQPPAVIVTAEGAANTPANRGLAGFTSKDHQVQNGQLGNITAEIEPLLNDLADIIAAEFKLRGATDDDLELSALAGIIVEGLYIDKLAPLGETLEALKFFYNFNLVPADGQIKAVLRGGASVRTIPFNELLAHDEGSEALAGIRIQHIESADLPGGVYVAWISPGDAKQFHTATQFVPLNSNGPSIEAETINLPLVVTDPDEIVAAGKRWLFLQHLVNHPLELNLDPKHRDLIPTDVVTLQLPQKTIDVSLTTKQAGLPGFVKAGAVPENAGLYNQTGIGQIGTGGEGRKVKFPANSFLYVGDLPLYSGEDDRLRWIAAACPRGLGNWQGAHLFKESIQASDEYQRLFSFEHPATLGHLDADVAGITDPLAIDHTSEITINLLADDESLASVTEADILARPVNQFVIGDGGDAEICRAATVTPQAASSPYVASYVLTDILHGLFGTEAAAVAGHSEGDTVLLLNDAVKFYTEEPIELNRERNFIAVSVGQALTDALANGAVPFTFRGYSKKDYAVTSVTGSRNAAGDAIVEWNRRDRGAGRLREVRELYLFQVLDGSDVVYESWVESPGGVPIPFTSALLETDGINAVRQRSSVRLDPYRSFFEATLKHQLVGLATMSLWSSDYSTQWWQMTLAPPFVYVYERDPSTGILVEKYSNSNHPEEGDDNVARMRPRFQIVNGELVVFESFVNEGSVPVYTSSLRPPEIGPLAPYTFCDEGDDVIDAIAGTGRPRAIFPANLQTELLGGPVALGDLSVRITQYSDLVGQGFPADALV